MWGITGDSRMIQLELPLPPSGNHRNGYNRRTGVYYRKQSTQNFFDHVAWSAMGLDMVGEIPLRGNIKAEIEIHRARKDQDGDNFLKCLFDALQEAGIIENDRNVIDVHYLVFNASKKTSKVVIKLESMG